MIKDPALYNEVNEYINSLNVEIRSFNDDEKYPAPAFVMKRFDNCVPYKVFYKNDEFEKYYLLHEYGHIYFAHINNEVLKENLIKSRLKYILPKNVSEEDFMRVFSMHLDNVTKDMEVNSKLFSDEEFEAFEKGTGNEYILPQRYGFPKGLEADTYLNLVLMDLDKFMDEDKGRQQRKNGDGDGKEQGNSSPMSNEDYLDSIEKELKETSSVNEKFESRVEQGDEEEGGQPNKKAGKKAGNGTKYEESDLNDDIKSNEDLKEFIRGIHTKKTRIVRKTDVMYNYNRRKTGTSVIVPKISSSYKKRDEKATLYILYDVSGSVNPELTEKVVKTISEICDELKTGSRVIFWNESLVNDIDIKDIGKVYCGGGTYLASGVKYIEQKYSPKKNDFVLIVSDFEDNIPLIGRFMNEIVAKKAALLWYSDDNGKEIKDEILENIENVKLRMFKNIE